MTQNSSTPPPTPFDLTTQNIDYQNWYEMINSIVNFVTASTQLASTLRKSQFPDNVEVIARIMEEPFNIGDFPWFLANLKDEHPLVQYPLDQVSHGEPNTEPRTINLIDTKDFGDTLAKEASNQSCFFQDYTDSEQTINSQNMQDNFEVQENQEVIEDLMMDCNVEEFVVVEDQEDKISAENKEQSVNTTDHFLSRFCRITEELHKLSGDGVIEILPGEDKTEAREESEAKISEKTDVVKKKKVTAPTKAEEKLHDKIKKVEETKVKKPKLIKLYKTDDTASKKKKVEPEPKRPSTATSDKPQKLPKPVSQTAKRPTTAKKPKENFITKNITQCTKPTKLLKSDDPKLIPVLLPLDSLDLKSCLKPTGRTIKPPRTCVIKENEVLTTPNLRMLRKDVTLKLTAAETVKKAAALLRDAEEKVLKPTTLAKRKGGLKGYSDLRKKSLQQ